MYAFTRYVALGDSFTEGVGDPYPPGFNALRGWADRVAEHLAFQNQNFRYANLAVRGRRMDDVVDGQIVSALALQPDLVTVHAGMNDLLKLRTNLDAMMARYAEGLKRLRDSGARVLVFTAADIGNKPVFKRLRGRAAIYNELLRGIVEDLRIDMVDHWRFTEFRDPLMWDGDRIHMSSLGHRQMAARVLDVLGVPHMLSGPSHLLLPHADGGTRLRSDLQWAASFAAPWVVRRLRRVTPGAGLEPKLASMTAVVWSETLMLQGHAEA